MSEQSADGSEQVSVPQDHRITAKPVGEAKLSTVTADGAELDWRRDIGLHHYTCSCGEAFEGRDTERQILEHLIDVGVLDWEDIDKEAYHS